VASSVEGNKEGSQATQLLNKKYTYTEETKANFKGEKNSFFGCKHTEETKNLQSEIKKGKQNPMYGKEKSPSATFETNVAAPAATFETNVAAPEFLYYMTKDRTGSNNPMYGKKKDPETIKKLSKPVRRYGAATKNLIMTFPGFVIAKNTLKMGSDTLKKYINTGNVYNDKYIFSFSFPL